MFETTETDDTTEREYDPAYHFAENNERGYGWIRGRRAPWPDNVCLPPEIFDHLPGVPVGQRGAASPGLVEVGQTFYPTEAEAMAALAAARESIRQSA